MLFLMTLFFQRILLWRPAVRTRRTARKRRCVKAPGTLRVWHEDKAARQRRTFGRPGKSHSNDTHGGRPAGAACALLESWREYVYIYMCIFCLLVFLCFSMVSVYCLV